MKSFTSRRFRELYSNLPDEIKLRAKRAYQLFRRNPAHPGLGFKKVHNQDDIYSARIGLGYRALAQLDGEDVVWFWIGTHAEYDRILRG
uniref:ParE-like toxin domain-containing protein n=1 Tax=Solibacter usitatus (strain Ellin6076) TaxID=234267 RepID=Q01T81_SOLUE